MEINRQVAPNILNAVDFDFDLKDIQTEILSNNIPFYSYIGGTQEVINIDLVFNAGQWYQNKNGVAMSALSLLKNGTTGKTSIVINETIDFYGASLSASASTDYAFVTLSCLSKHVQQLLPLLKEILLDCTFPDKEIQIFKQRTIQKMMVSLKKSDFVANRKIDEYVFGYAHPYGTYNEITHIENITQADLIEFKNSYLHYKNCTIFVAGNFENAVLTEIKNLFGTDNWNQPTAVVAPPTIVKAPATTMHHRVSNDVNGVQGSVRLSSPFVTKEHPDFLPMVIVNTLFGGYFGSRLMSNIREDKGYTYGIHSYIYNLKQDGAIGISTEAGKDVAEATVQEVYKEMELLRTTLVDEQELTLVKNYMLGGLKGEMDGPFQIMQRWKNILLFNFTKERFNTSIHTYKTITPQQIQELANKYLVQDSFYELIVV